MWAVTKTGKDTLSFQPLRGLKHFLMVNERNGIGLWTTSREFTRFNTKSEARKVCNARVISEIKCCGHNYVKNWIYGVEEITD